jgi:hypothetical protein
MGYDSFGFRLNNAIQTGQRPSVNIDGGLIRKEIK